MCTIIEPELIIKFYNLEYMYHDNINQTFGLDKLYKDTIDKYELEEIKDGDNSTLVYIAGGSRWNYFVDHIQDARLNILKQFCFLYLQIINERITPITKSNRRQELGLYIDSIKVYVDNTKINYPLNDKSNYINLTYNDTAQISPFITYNNLKHYLHFTNYDFDFRKWRMGYSYRRCISELFRFIHITFKYRQIDNTTNLLLATYDFKHHIDTEYLINRPYITDDDILEFCFNHSLNLRKMITYKYTDIGTIQITFD